MSAKPTPDQQAKRYQAKIRRKPAKSEHCLQRKIVQWCNGIGYGYVRDCFAAIPNGGTRGGDAKSRMIAGARLKAEGVRKGMPDLVFWCRGRVLWMEVKLGTSGRVSDDQLEVHCSLEMCGFDVVIARDLASACQAIIRFYNPEPEGRAGS